MDPIDFIHEFINDSCKIEFKIPDIAQNVKNVDVFVYENILLLAIDVNKVRFKCTRFFDLDSMKSIPIAFDSEHSQFTCVLQCKQSELNTTSTKQPQFSDYKRVTDLCTLSLDGNICEIQANYPYGFSAQYRGKPKFNYGDLSQICGIEDPSCMSPIQRRIEQEKEEIKNFCPEQYKLDLYELQIPEGHADPMKYKITFKNDIKLTKDEEFILEKIRAKHVGKFLEDYEKPRIDCGLVSILLGICYDIRLTENEPTCESHWTRSILSSVLSYFDTFNSFNSVVKSFCRRSLIYPLYRNFKLSCLCVQDVADALLEGKSWILKQLLITYNCFNESENSRKALNKYFIRHYIWYVDSIMADEQFENISSELNLQLKIINESDLGLGLGAITLELCRDVMSELVSKMSIRVKSDDSTESEYSSDSDCAEYSSDSDVSIKKILI